MYTKSRYSLKDLARWTRWETYLFLAIALLVTMLYEVAGLQWLRLPWTPIALVGTALAFLIGFQNNAAYGRLWEARKIWGGIVNTSRSWGMKVKDMVTNEYAPDPASDGELKEHVRALVYRHVAWMTALRHAMRQRRSWEITMDHRANKEWAQMIHVPERENTLEDELTPYLSAEEKARVLSKSNKQTALLFLQSQHLRQLKERGLIWEFSFLELENILQELFTLQGQSERIKNFPYPRQYATLGYYFVWSFVLLLPFGVIPEFSMIGEKLVDAYPLVGQYFVWLSIPFIVIVAWVFHTMHRIGTVGENPFEGSANDVPISTIARGIEIDLREMLDEQKEEIPAQFPAQYEVQM